MPTLRRWFEREYIRLEAEEKRALVDRFETFSHAFFEADYQTALNALPDLYRLADALGEPAWHLVAQYYAISAEIYWHGDLTRGLELATEALVRARTMVGLDPVLELYIRETLLYAWLETDGPGYAPDVLSVLDELSPDLLAKDLATRFALLRTYGMAYCGAPDEALALVFSLLPELSDWPPPFHHALRGEALGRVGRLDEALAEYEQAERGFEELGYVIERNATRLGMGDMLVRTERAEEGLRVLRAALSAAKHGINRATTGVAQGLIGKALAAQGQPGEALDWFTMALETLDGRGWLRTEAEFSLERLKALQLTDGHRYATRWQADARQRIGRLRSTDLQRELATLSGSGEVS